MSGVWTPPQNFLTPEVKQALKVILTALIDEPIADARKKNTRRKNAKKRKPQCRSLTGSHRCTRDSGHRGRHRAGVISWDNKQKKVKRT